MQIIPLPWKVLASSHGAGVLTPGWTLDQCDPDTDQDRCFIVDITFASPFTTAPVVHLALTGFDLDQRDTARLSLKAENITTAGFQAVISTWASTRVFAVEINWLAIGS